MLPPLVTVAAGMSTARELARPTRLPVIAVLLDRAVLSPVVSFLPVTAPDASVPLNEQRTTGSVLTGDVSLVSVATGSIRLVSSAVMLIASLAVPCTSPSTPSSTDRADRGRVLSHEV